MPSTTILQTEFRHCMSNTCEQNNDYLKYLNDATNCRTLHNKNNRQT